jgi:hypothetical protein
MRLTPCSRKLKLFWNLDQRWGDTFLIPDLVRYGSSGRAGKLAYVACPCKLAGGNKIFWAFQTRSSRAEFTASH